MDVLAAWWQTQPGGFCLQDLVTDTCFQQYEYPLQYVPSPCGTGGSDAIYFSPTAASYWAAQVASADFIVLAHEWGHRVQFAAGGLPPNKATELAADCLAGVFFGGYDTFAGFTHEDLLYDTMCAIGDPGYSAWWQGTHGVCDERVCAVAEGYAAGVEDPLCDPEVSVAFCLQVAAICAQS
ncbi:MAG: hypothetical protein IPK74_16125 [Deltaproteobacteria bacterium]|nr:hypothetical protein [Deltaproteobacteria bacterium]